MKTVLGLTVACLVSLSAVAHAQPGLSAPGVSPQQPAPPSNLESYEPSSPNAALAWSLLATGLGYGAAIAGAEDENTPLAIAAATGILVGPNAGDIYAGDAGRALLHTGIRGGAVLMTIAGAVQAFDECGFEEDPCDASGGEALAYAGIGLFVADSLYSIFTAPRTAREQNEKERQRLMIAPTAIAAANRPTGMGLSLTGSF